MSNSNFVITQAATNTSGVKALNSIIPTCPFFDPTGNLDMNGLALIGNASSATEVALTSDNTSGAYFIPFSKTTSTTSNALYIDNATTPLTYNPSLSTLTATIFSTATAPVSANQLGNKTYIDNFGGTGGWYYTTTVSITGGTTFNFPNSLSSNYNAYEVYFVSNISSPITGYPSIQMSFSGLSSPTYTTWSSSISSVSGAAPAFVNAYGTSAPFLAFSMDYSNVINRVFTYKLDLWGTKSISGGAGAGRINYLTEGQVSSNPGFTGWIKQMGNVSYTSGNTTGITLTMSTATTGSMTIIVKASY